MKIEINLNKTYKQISYLTVKTPHPYYNGKSFNGIYKKKSLFILRNVVEHLEELEVDVRANGHVY